MTVMTPGFTLCFLLHNNDILMLHRHFPPNQGLWNGVGGHIKPGETPRQAVIREVKEETGFQITDPQFAGLMTWDGFEIAPGAIAIFTAEVPHKDFVPNHEGILAWKPRPWVCSAPEVVDNIHVFLPKILAGEGPLHYHFRYRDGRRIADRVSELPDSFTTEKPYHPEPNILEEERGEFLLSFDKERLQLEVIEDFLARRSYWGKGRSLHEIENSIQNSVCLGIYQLGKQVGFARLVTDKTTFGWLCDVYVDEKHRGQGLGKWLVEAVCRFSDQCGIDKILLATRDAQQFYKVYGSFRVLESEGKWMIR